MKIELPLVVGRGPGRLLEGCVPPLQLTAQGLSESVLRDELALAVMERFESRPGGGLAVFQRAPHQRLRHVDVDTFFRAPEGGTAPAGAKVVLQGRLAVLLEKWPEDDFWVATPVKDPTLRFALNSLGELASALPRRLAELGTKGKLASLEALRTLGHERLDILEVDVYPPTLLPRSPRRARLTRLPPAPALGGEVLPLDPESPEEKEARRRRRRLSASALRAVGRNLSGAAEDGQLGRAHGRDPLADELADALFGREGGAFVLLGPSGVGKTAIINEVAHRLGARYRPVGLRRDLWRVDGGRFIAGMSCVGQWEQRARDLCSELEDTGDVLVADDLCSLVLAGRTSNSARNVAQYLEPFIARRTIAVLAESTPERWARVRELAPTFAALFRVVAVPALDQLATLRALLGLLRQRESENGPLLPARVDPAALELVLTSSARFRPHEAFPGKAVRLLDRVLAGPGQADEEHGWRRFDASHVFDALNAETGLPPFVLGAERPRNEAQIRAALSAQIAGQDEAIDALTEVVVTLQAGLGDPEKPLRTLLFVGPTGVGKTESAKGLARYLFGSADRLLRFDMSEMNTPAAVARFVGEAGGAEGELVSALRTQPFRVVLLDEVEKAHPQIFDALLQLLGEGRLTDAAGHTAYASSSVIVLTSNLGVREAAARPGFGAEAHASRQHYLGAVRAFFRPEFFNRIDRIVPFVPLDPRALRVVVEHALSDLLSRRGLQRGRVLVNVEPELLDQLVEQAYDPRYGARPLRRLLERRLTVPLAAHLASRVGEDLALVELFRRREDLGIAVKLLTDGPQAPTSHLRDDADLADLRLTVKEMRQEVATRLEDTSNGELAQAHAALLDHDRDLATLEENELEETTFVEEIDGLSYSDGRGDRSNYRPHRGGLRRREGYREHPVYVRRLVAERRARPLVKQHAERLSLLRHEIDAAKGPRTEGEGDRCVLLLELVGLAAPAVLERVAELRLHRLLFASRWDEVPSGDAASPWGWREHRAQPASAPPVVARRIALLFDRPGTAELLRRWAGWAVLTTQAEGSGMALFVPVRLELLTGGIEAIIARDASLATARAARREGGPTSAPDDEARISLRSELDGPLLATATGEAADAGEGHTLAAALVRLAEANRTPTAPPKPKLRAAARARRSPKDEDLDDDDGDDRHG